MLGRILLLTTLVGVALALPSKAKCESPLRWGEIKWAIYDNEKSTLVATGESVLAASDFEICRIRSRQYSKRIALSAPFFITLSETGSDKSVNKGGFGLTGGRADEKLFSWEWFKIDKPNHAVKIQDNGEVYFTTRKTNFGYEIERLEFPVDLSLRIYKKDVWLPTSPKWRIRILKGSWIMWPAVSTIHRKY